MVAADHAVHGRLGLRALRVRHVVHAHGDVVYRQRAVDGHADRHAVDGFARLPDAVAGNHEHLLLRVAQRALDVPKAVVTLVSAINDGAGVLVRAGRGRRKRQDGLLSWAGRSGGKRERLDCPGLKAEALSRAGGEWTAEGARVCGVSRAIKLDFTDKNGQYPSWMGHFQL
jgi:hypothetical protein